MSDVPESKMPESFFELLNSPNLVSVVIPIIQRDYAQGRNDTGNSKRYSQIRDGMLDTLYNAIVGDKPATLDFVYGSTSGGRFTPIDGQQRLTTLFLLHWYLAVKEKKLLGEDGLSRLLSKFTYEVRDSATEFCDNLSHNYIDLAEKPSQEICNAYWYHRVYSSDPTVTAMLVMLDAIHDKFKDCPDGTLSRLTNEHRITFKLLFLESFGLTDDLFIKMNARGKPLSTFDVFKSKVESELDKSTQTSDLIEKWKENIDNDWVDAFWEIFDEKRSEGCLFNIILNITRLMIAKSPSTDYQVYDDVKNIDYKADIAIICDNTLDFLSQTLNKTKGFSNDSLWKKFANNESNITYSDRASFYAKMRYDFVMRPNTDEAANFERITRNLIIGQRDIQQNNKQFQSKLNAENIGSFLIALDELINLSKETGCIYNALLSKPTIKGLDYLSFEIEKVEYFYANGIIDTDKFDEIRALESSDHLHGLIHNVFFDGVLHLTKDKFDELVVYNHSLVLRCIQSFSDKPLWKEKYQGNYHYLWISDSDSPAYYRYFYGMNASVFGDYLWTAIDSAMKKPIQNFVKAYTQSTEPGVNIKLNNLLRGNVNGMSTCNTAYYLSAYNEFYNDTGYCVALLPWRNIQNFRILKTGYNIWNNNHGNPYYIALDNMLKEGKLKVQIENSLFCNWNNIQTTDSISLTNKVIMKLTDSRNWRVEIQNVTISPEAATMLSNSELLVNNNEDCIKKAYNFISVI